MGDRVRYHCKGAGLDQLQVKKAMSFENAIPHIIAAGVYCVAKVIDIAFWIVLKALEQALPQVGIVYDSCVQVAPDTRTGRQKRFRAHLFLRFDGL
jgi:hypothetical protein